MGTYNANILPAVTGLTLGNQNQQWTSYLSNCFTGVVVSNNAVNIASSGFIRMASTDFIAWRNNSNSTDILLAKTGPGSGTLPADVLTFSGGGIQGTLFSPSANPASTGIYRLASSDSINFRNNANTGDVAGFSKNSSDVVIVGGAAGVQTNSILTVTTGGIVVTGGSIITGTFSVSSTLTAQSIQGPNSGTFNINAGVPGSGAALPLAITGGSGVGVQAGGTVTITGGSAVGATNPGGNVIINGGPGAGGGATGTLQTNTTVSQYAGVTTAGQGLVATYGATVQKAETQAADANVLTFTPPASAGTYRLTVTASVASATSGVIAFTLNWKDSNSNAQTSIGVPLFQFGTAAPNVTFTTSAAGNYSGGMTVDVDNSATAIIVKWTGGGTTVAKVSAILERIA